MEKITDNAYASCDLKLASVRIAPEALLGGEGFLVATPMARYLG